MTRWSIRSMCGTLALLAVAASWLAGVWRMPASRAQDGPAPVATRGPGADKATHASGSPTSRPATGVHIAVPHATGTPEEVQDPAAQAWRGAPATAVLLSRTPRIYKTEKPTWRSGPITLTVRALRAGKRLYLRLEWPDATVNAPHSAPPRAGRKGDVPRRLSRRQTTQPASFPDAAAVMVPDNWQGPAFPSLMMGDKSHPTSLYYWNASRGSAVLRATGRTTPQPARGRTLTHASSHRDGTWSLVLEMPDLPDGCPLAFAVWDGALGDRDGLKYFSVWHQLTNGR